MGHIELSREADLLVVAPATADLIAKVAHRPRRRSRDDDAAGDRQEALVAPAMNLRMWLHPATQRNVATLRGDGVLFVGPDDGEMACGEYGPGRMSEPLEIVAAIDAALEAAPPFRCRPASASVATPAGLLAGRRVVVTSGPTHEPIDPVRYLGNRSSGQQGHAIAEAAAAAGAEVILVSGPVALADPRLARSSRSRRRARCGGRENALPADIFVAAAAVADWRVDGVGGEKIKKGRAARRSFISSRTPTFSPMSRRVANRPRLVVGFAAETQALIDNARAKLKRRAAT